MSTVLRNSPRGTNRGADRSSSQQNSVIIEGKDSPPHVTKSHLPSRYAPPNNPLILSQKTLLTKVEQTLERTAAAKKHVSPHHAATRSIEKEELLMSQIKVNASQDLKLQPLRKNEHDFLLFKDIFVKPKETRLQELQHKSVKPASTAHGNNRYDELMEGRQEGHTKVVRSYYEQSHNPNLMKLPAIKKAPSIPKAEDKTASLDVTEKLAASTMEPDLKAQEKSMNESETDQTFFEQQIQVQPPDQPNSTLASPLTPGNGWAPSIPPTSEDIVKKPNLKDLLVRAKAGMQAGDIQKEAHLSFYLGIVQEGNDQPVEAIRYFKKYFSCAKALEDKIGMALAMNHIGTSYHKLKKHDKSIQCHLRHLDLTTMDNAFAAYYNLGISYRNTQQHDESLIYFRKALEWARDQKDIQSECLSLGQLGVTCLGQGNLAEARTNLEDCYNLTLRLKNNKLQLDCLMYISKISNEETREAESDYSMQRYQDAYKCARTIGDLKYASLSIINMGVLEGNEKYQQYLKNVQSQMLPVAQPPQEDARESS